MFNTVLQNFFWKIVLTRTLAVRIKVYHVPQSNREGVNA